MEMLLFNKVFFYSYKNGTHIRKSKSIFYAKMVQSLFRKTKEYKAILGGKVTFAY